MEILRRKEIPSDLSIRRASKLLRVPRSRVYYKGKGESYENRKLMEEIEEAYSKDPCLGYRKMKALLERRTGKKVNHKRVLRLMRLMGLRGISPPPKTTITGIKDAENLLKDLRATRPNQVWCSDITYFRVKGGFAYGVSIMDLYSRKVLAFEVSNTMDEGLCLEAVKKAMERYGAPGIIHTDRGRQFVGKRFRVLFEERGSRVSVGGRGFRDNIVIERFWRSLKWECVYLRERLGLGELRKLVKEWVEYYNGERPHSSLGYRTPDEAYFEGLDKCQVA